MEEDRSESVEASGGEASIDQIARSLANAAPRRTALHQMAAAGAGLLGALGLAGAAAQGGGDNKKKSKKANKSTNKDQNA
ncbi:MAG TPA: hypothetical protein VFI22_14435, partial [Thermomicrobiales bacterium]|nr:hypothetical protein [Thermomicrobiales bacterium]